MTVYLTAEQVLFVHNACAALFLQQDGILFLAENAELEKFTLRVASSDAGRSEITEWLKKHSHS